MKLQNWTLPFLSSWKGNQNLFSDPGRALWSYTFLSRVYIKRHGGIFEQPFRLVIWGVGWSQTFSSLSERRQYILSEVDSLTHMLQSFISTAISGAVTSSYWKDKTLLSSFSLLSLNLTSRKCFANHTNSTPHPFLISLSTPNLAFFVSPIVVLGAFSQRTKKNCTHTALYL